jgi:hypothetical protein
MASSDYISKPQRILDYELSLYPYHKSPLAIQRHLDVNYRYEDAVGDGNCLFRALSLGLYGNQNHHAQLRQEACNAFDSSHADYNPDILQHNPDKAYILSTCREPGEWGGDPHMVAIALKHKARIVIYSMRTEKWFVNAEPINGKETKHLVWLKYVDDTHYGGYVFVSASPARIRPVSSIPPSAHAATTTWDAAHTWFGDSYTNDRYGDDDDDDDIDTTRRQTIFPRTTVSAVSTSTFSTRDGSAPRRLKTTDDFLRALREMRSEMGIRDRALD